MTNQGWKCPGCSACYAPHVEECKRCAPDEKQAAQPFTIQPPCPMPHYPPVWVEPWRYVAPPWPQPHIGDWPIGPTITYTSTGNAPPAGTFTISSVGGGSFRA